MFYTIGLFVSVWLLEYSNSVVHNKFDCSYAFLDLFIYICTAVTLSSFFSAVRNQKKNPKLAFGHTSLAIISVSSLIFAKCVQHMGLSTLTGQSLILCASIAVLSWSMLDIFAKRMQINYFSTHTNIMLSLVSSAAIFSTLFWIYGFSVVNYLISNSMWIFGSAGVLAFGILGFHQLMQTLKTPDSFKVDQNILKDSDKS